MTDERRHLSGMLDFAAGLLESREKARFQMSDGGGAVWREEVVAGLPGVALNDGEVWMRVSRLRETPPPPVPVPWDAWLADDPNAPERPPGLVSELSVRMAIEDASDAVEAGLADPEDCTAITHVDPDTGEVSESPDEVMVRLALARMPEFAAGFADWVAAAWAPWAAEEGPRRQSIRVYQGLFKLHGMMQAGSTGFELVWGIGVARWRCPGGRVLDAPLIEVLTDLELENDGHMAVRPRTVVRPRLAMGPYVELDLPGAIATQADLQTLLDRANEDPDGGITPFDAHTHVHILERAVARLTDSAVLLRRADRADGAPPAPVTERLTIHEDWALYARPRSEQLRRDDLEAIARRVETEDLELPAPLLGFVQELRAEGPTDELDFGPGFLAAPATATGPMAPTAPRTPAPEREIPLERDPHFFPLPYNAEQARIIDTLEAQGVAVVQGPPGTGKSHSIANIIAHYMAIGRRVLVTARTAEAISVVQEKLPEDLQRLTIAVVHSDREGARQLEGAVSTLAREASSADTAALHEKILGLEADILAGDRAIREIDARLAEIARENLHEVTYRGATMMPMDLAADLSGQADRHGWFRDRPDTETPPEDLIDTVARARAEVADDLGYLPLLGAEGLALPRATDLPPAADLIAANRVAAQLHATPEEDLSDAPLMARDSADVEEMARALQAELMALEDWLDDRGLRRGYAMQAMARLNGGALPGDDPILQALAMLRRFMEATRDLRPRRSRWPSHADAEEFWGAVAELAAGRQPLGWAAGLFRRRLKAELEGVRVEDRPAGSPEDWRAALHYRRWREAFDALMEGWPDAHVPELPVREADPDRAGQAIAAILADLERVVERAEAAPLLRDRILRLFPYGLSPAEALGRADHCAILRALRANLRAAPPRHPALVALEAAAQGATPVQGLMSELAAALDGPEVPPAQIVEARNALGAELERLHGRVPELRAFADALDRLADAGVPHWAGQLRDPAATAADVLPEDWGAAWAWGAGMRKVEHLLALEDTEPLLARKTALTDTRRRLLRETIAARTLLGLARRVPRFHAPLQMFTQAIRRLGAGTGQQAGRWRRQIQAAALEAAPAIPVWIMPEYRVAEQLPREVGDFDLVILDEASQSDITALGALARGKRILIVGDDEQVSPTAIGIPTERVTALRTRHLRGLRHGEMIDAESSIFDLAQMMFPAAQVTLREHFRSVAPIIAFSSQFYEGGLVPLRVPRASERIDPPLVDIFIPHGAREGRRTVNPAEAEAIVDEIARITADPALAGRSIGVISLIGAHQAETIERMLMAHPEIGTEKIREHRIICGDSSTLQGQERDIVLLSMVSDRNSIRLMQTRQTGQRFNVAMSRARDRLYLVRSIGLSHLNPVDFRARVIAHFNEPLPEGTRLVARDLLDRCQSGFEREVCQRLIDAGYRVIPQMQAGAFSIDLVVEGTEDRRLAIELDGDRYHGPDRWHRDMERQAALERAGWIFWRVFGSQWKADPELWWGRLTDRLDALGIAPIGSAGVADVLTEHRVIEAPAEVEALAPETVASAVGAPALASAPASDDVTAAPASSEDRVPPGARAARRTRPEQPVVPGPAAGPIFRAPEDETVFHIEDAAPETVAPGLFVTIRYLDDRSQKTILISETDHRPDEGVIQVDKPLAQALIGAAVGEELALSLGNRQRSLVVEAVFAREPLAAE